MTPLDIKIFFFLITAWGLLHVAGCGPVATYTGDDASSDGAPSRLVSLTLMTDEMLLDLVVPERIAALSAFAADPRLSNVAERAGDYPAMAFHVEPVLALRPDRVFVADWSDEAKVNQLRAAGIPVTLVRSPTSMDEIRVALLDVARTVHVEARAHELIATMDRILAEVEKQVSTIPPGERLTVLDLHAWGSVSAAGSSWDALLQAAGLVNAAAGLRSDRHGQAPLSTEKLLVLDPDLIVLPGWLPGDPGAAERFRENLLADPSLRPLRALQTGQVLLMPERLRSTTSHYIAHGVAFLSEAAYGAGQACSAEAGKLTPSALE